MAILDKVSALLNKAKSTDSQAEADALMSKAQQLMRENNISEFDLNRHKNNINRLVVICRGWQKQLLICLCSNNSCILTKRGSTNHINGNDDDIKVVLFLFEFYLNCLKKLSENAYNQSNKTQSKISYKSDYCIGATHGLIDKLKKEKNVHETINPELQALMVVKKDAVNEYLQSLLGKLGTIKSGYKPTVNHSAYLKGKEDAHSISTANKQLA